MSPICPPRLRISVAALVLGLFLPVASAAAQRDAIELPPDRFGIKAPLPRAELSDAPVVPPPPRAILPWTPKHPLPPIPSGVGGNPQPQTPPAVEMAAGAPLAGTGAFTYFKNSVVKPAGALRSTSSVVEPAAANVRDTVLQTGNWYAALSKDHGQTWSHLSPFTFFGHAPDGGFCCDQRVEYVRSHDITVWLLQYLYSPTTRNGSYQLAVANGRDELRSGNAADWTLYRFDPTDFGFPLGNFLDFPDIGFNDDWLYLSANVYDGATYSFVGAVVWRVALYDLQLNRPATFSYLTNATMGGSSYRFATRAGDGSNMYWATLMTTTSLRIWRQNTIGINRNYVDRTTAVWSNVPSTACTGPDNRDWLSNAMDRIRGACGTANELVFTWTSAGNGTTRPLPYTRVARFRESDRTLLAEHDVYSTTDCWAYAAVDSNRLGDIGGVIAIGGPTKHVRTSAFLIDQYGTWSGVVAYRMADPTNNPPGEVFGDYFDVQRSYIDERNFVGTGTLMNGGDLNTHVEPHHVWFGRNDYEPTWVDLEVISSPVQGIAIQLDVTDNNGQKDGTTRFRRTFAPHQGYTLTTPTSLVVNGTTLHLDRWVLNGVSRLPNGGVLTVSTIGPDNDTVEARYRAQRTITFDTSAHIGTLGLTVSPMDLNGQGPGFTVFTRQYLQDTQVTVTVPAPSYGGHPFDHWRIDGVNYPRGQLSATFTVGNNDARATAVYSVYTPGTFTSYGAGCSGSNGLNLHSGFGRPELGQTAQWVLVGGATSSPAVLVLGASRTQWLGIPLPLPLPNAPGCNLMASMDLTFPTATGSGGVCQFPVTLPTDPSLIGGHVFTQFGVVDLAANAFGLTVSNGLDTSIGGVR